MSDMSISDLPMETDGEFRQVRIDPPASVVSRVILTADSADSELYGIQFFTTDGKKVLDAGDCEVGLARKQFDLQHNERIVGIKASVGRWKTPRMRDVQLVIARTN